MEYLESRHAVPDRYYDPSHVGAWSVGQGRFSTVGSRANISLYWVDTTGVDFD